ncbi:hypothetical protein N7513_001745 [Penicillium frequentans]|nr:hypothetical protein N7513_001745 [Penicillium glabrum]
MNNRAFSGQNSGYQIGDISGLLSINTFPYQLEGPPTRPPKPTSTVPFLRNVDFIGRNTLLDQIDKKISVPGSWVAFVGIGGVGKSQLAIEYSYQVRVKSPETWVLWIHASNAARFEQSFQQIVRILKIPETRDANTFERVEAWLRDESNGKWLVILDNLDDIEVLHHDCTVRGVSQHGAGPIKPLVHYVPQVSHGSIIITSRNRGAVNSIVHLRNIISIDPMDRSESLELLRRNLPDTSVADDQCAQLVEQLEFMPLPIIHAAAFISNHSPRFLVSHYLKRLREDKEAIKLLKYKEGYVNRDWEAENSILSTWQISFDHIKRLRPSAADLLSLMSLCDRSGIPECVLRGSQGVIDLKENESEIDYENESPSGSEMDESSGSWETSEEEWSDSMTDEGRSSSEDELDADGDEMEDLQEAMNGIDVDDVICLQAFNDYFEQLLDNDNENNSDYDDPSNVFGVDDSDHFEDDIAMLRNYAFIGVSEHHTHFTMHRLVQITTHEWLENSGEAENWKAKFIQNLCKILPSDDYNTWEMWRLLFPHVKLATSYLTGSHDHQTVQCWLQLMDRGISYARAISNWSDVRQMASRSREVRMIAFGRNGRGMLDVTRNLMDGYAHEEDLWNKAERLGFEMMDISKNKFGRYHLITTSSLINFARIYSNESRWGEAENIMVDVLRRNKIQLGKTHPETLQSMLLLSSIYASQNRFDESMKIARDVFKIEKANRGSQGKKAEHYVVNLASAYAKAGRFNDAERILIQHLKVLKTEFGKDYPWALDIMELLAVLYEKQDRFSEAEGLILYLIQKRKTQKGKDNWETLYDMNLLAGLRERQGQLEEAEDILTRVLNTTKDRYGEENVRTVHVSIQLTRVHRLQGRLTEAEVKQIHIWKSCEARLGPDNGNTLDAMLELSKTRKLQGRLTDAINLLGTYMDRVRGKEAPDIRELEASETLMSDWKRELELSGRMDFFPVQSNLPQKRRRQSEGGEVESSMLEERNDASDMLSDLMAIDI